MRNILWLYLILGLVLSGCSNDIISTSSISSVPSANLESNMGFLGEFHLEIDSSSMTAQLTSNRESAIGESYLVSGLYYFTGVHCASCFKIKTIKRDFDDSFVITFTLKHPFEQGNISLPPSSTNRLDLDIFDLRLIIRNTTLTPISFSLTGTALNPGRVKNVDGYTHELGDLLGSDLLMPFVLIQDDTKEIPVTDGHFNRFRMGESKDFDVSFMLSQGESYDCSLFITFGYGASARLDQRLNPIYYNPEFNRKEAWKVVVLPAGYWDSLDDVNPIIVSVLVWDWQAGANINPNLENPSDVYLMSDIQHVSVEIPGMTNALAISYTPVTGVGSPTDPFVYQLPIVNQNLLPPGYYGSIVKVKDLRDPKPFSENRDFLIHTPDGLNRSQYQIPEYATFQYFIAGVN